MNLRGLTRALSRDADKRRLYWLLSRPALQQSHREALAAIGWRLTPADRALVRTLFSLYRPVGVPPIEGR